MKQKILKTSTLFIIVLLLPLNVINSQVKVSEVIQYSKTAESNENKLYLIDFWATWCAPCIHVKKYLGSLQKQYPKDFYIVSISEENPEKVKKFLSKNPTTLAVAIDFEGETFNKNKIRVLPHAILVNADGHIVWEGAPADLKNHHIEKFLKQYKKRASFKDIFEIKDIAVTDVTSYIPTSDFEIKELNDTMNTNIEVNEQNGYLKLQGKLSNILSYASNVYSEQIEVPESMNKYYQIFIRKDSNAYKNIEDTILSDLNLQYTTEQSKGEALVLKVETPTFWDTTQINWGTGSPSFMVGDSEIKADNVSLYEVSNVLAKAIEMPVIIEPSGFDTSGKHDWQIHYKYFNLMQGELQDSYGIKAEKKQTSYTVFSVTKKAP
ncbi:thioredoxin-like domain-containing protein [Winogradskyella sp. 3972H.M.0a.05]|uniref:TlpA family protein disulfide reductase n=1 Tax=Winogradskyella sp. 3972H.M.0a.05 TaxID=2950277 RepID=UPI0033914A3A